MDNTKHTTLLYDSNCPLCSGYTAAFVGMGWLSPEGRVDYASAPQAQCERVDMDRARHEIALLHEGGVSYGVDALGDLIAERSPLLRPLARRKWLRAPFRPLYNFITYNRRLIAGTPDRPDLPGDCAPDFHFGWRMAFLMLGVVGWVLFVAGTTPWTAIPAMIALSFSLVPALDKGLRPGMDVAAQFAVAGWGALAASVLLPPLIGFFFFAGPASGIHLLAPLCGMVTASVMLNRRLPRYGANITFAMLSCFSLIHGGILLTYTQ